MGDHGDIAARRRSRPRLADIVRQVKIEAAERGDVALDRQEAERARLELLAQELQPVFEDVPQGIEQFDFAISSGLQPRLWIDAVAHVMMGRDRRQYRFVRDTRYGRIVLAETDDLKSMAGSVARYIAERLIERERMLDGVAVPVAGAAPAGQTAEHGKSGGEADFPEEDADGHTHGAGGQEPRSGRVFLETMLWFLIGGTAGTAVLAALYWFSLAR